MATGKKVNKSMQKAKKEELKKSLLHGLDTKGSIKNSGIETLRDVVVGVVGGGLVGAAIGKPSLYIGAGVTGAGHYIGSRTVSLLGIGMMASNGFQTKSTEGLDGMNMESIKARMNAYKNSFMEKTYVDKLMHKKDSEGSSSKASSKEKLPAKQETSGFGELQFFNYPNDMNGSVLAPLENIHEQIRYKGQQHMEENNMSMSDVEETGGLDQTPEYQLFDARDYNY